MNAPRALFGGLLTGSNAVRFVFMDEAGTESRSPVTVVAAVTAHADRDIILAEASVDEALRMVPAAVAALNGGFVFSAKDTWNNDEYWPLWSMADRLAFLRAMMSIPRKRGLAVTISIMWRGRTKYAPELKVPPHQMDHIMAVASCAARADKFIRDCCGADEIGTVVAEQASEMTKYLRMAINFYRNNPMTLPPEMLRLTAEEVALGYLKQESVFSVSRIRPVPHFVDKKDDRMVYLADACAYAFRRFFCKEGFGQQWVENVLGRPMPNPSDWEEGGCQTYPFRKGENWGEEAKVTR